MERKTSKSKWILFQFLTVCWKTMVTSSSPEVRCRSRARDKWPRISCTETRRGRFRLNRPRMQHRKRMAWQYWKVGISGISKKIITKIFAMKKLIIEYHTRGHILEVENLRKCVTIFDSNILGKINRSKFHQSIYFK